MELYLHTIEALINNGPINLSRLTLKTKINCSPLKTILLDLIQKKIVKQRKISGNILYVATPRARSVLSHFRVLAKFLPVF